MSVDFSVKRIVTLGTTDNSLEGVQVIRNATELTYNLARVSLSKAALGADYQTVDSTTVSAKVDRQNVTPTRYRGNSTNGTNGTAAFSVSTLNLKSTHNARQGTDADNAGGVTLRTYASGYALAAGEVYKVKVGGVLKTVITDYTVSGANIVFTYTKAPKHIGPSVEIFALSNPAALGDEVVQVSVDGTLVDLVTDYTITNGVVTFEAGSVPTTGQAIAIWFRTPGTRVYTGVSLTGLDATNSATTTPSPKVYINDGGGYDAVDAGDFTWTPPDPGVAPGSVSFDADKIPADGYIVQLRYQMDFNDTFAIPGAVAVGDDAAPEVWIDDTKKTVETHYNITNRVVVFEAAGMPTVGQVVKVIDVSAAAGIVPAGGYTFFDSNQGNSPGWDYIRAGGSTVVEVM